MAGSVDTPRLTDARRGVRSVDAPFLYISMEGMDAARC